MTDQIFGPAPIRHDTVVLNCASGPIQDLGVIADAFHATAKEAVGALRSDPGFGPRGGLDDYRAYPILFMYRHAVELSLKQVIIYGGFVLEYTKKGQLGDRVLREHGIRPLVAELNNLAPSTSGVTSGVVRRSQRLKSSMASLMRSQTLMRSHLRFATP